MTRDRAETIALQALTFLAADTDRLGRFLAETGIGPAELASRASERDFQVSVLDWLLADETMLMVLTTQSDIGPAEVLPARHVLSGDMTASA